MDFLKPYPKHKSVTENVQASQDLPLSGSGHVSQEKLPEEAQAGVPNQTGSEDLMDESTGVDHPLDESIMAIHHEVAEDHELPDCKTENTNLRNIVLTFTEETPVMNDTTAKSAHSQTHSLTNPCSDITTSFSPMALLADGTQLHIDSC